MSGPENGPALRVVAGSPTSEELAVLAAVIAAASAAGGATEPERVAARGRWNDPVRSHRKPWLPGPGAWRATYLG